MVNAELGTTWREEKKKYFAAQNKFSYYASYNFYKESWYYIYLNKNMTELVEVNRTTISVLRYVGVGLNLDLEICVLPFLRLVKMAE